MKESDQVRKTYNNLFHEFKENTYQNIITTYTLT